MQIGTTFKPRRMIVAHMRNKYKVTWSVAKYCTRLLPRGLLNWDRRPFSASAVETHRKLVRKRQA